MHKNNVSVLIFVATFLFFLTLVGGSFAGSSHRYIVTGRDVRGLKAEVMQNGGQTLHDLAYFEGFVANMSQAAAQAVKNRFGNSATVEEDALVSINAGGKGGGGTTPPPPQTIPWGVSAVLASEANSLTTGSGVVVCVVDTGIQASHPDLAANIIGGENFVFGKGGVDPNKWDDENGHGTHVAGTIAALDNSIGVVGVAPGASLFAARVLDRRGSGYVSDVADGIVACVDTAHADVISMSLGAASGATVLAEAVSYASAQGVVLVAAAGNDGRADVSYPAKYPEVLAISAMDSSYHLAYYSNYGADIDYIAPGSSVLSCYKGGTYATLSGTSMATPHVSGVVALMIASGSQGLVATDIGLPTTEQGLGLVDAAATVANIP